MKRSLLALTCALCLSAPVLSAGNSIDPRFWKHKHKDANKAAAAPTKPKEKKSFLHRASKPSRQDAAHSEATYGMTGPKSVGWHHPEPGPAGYGAN